MSVHSLPVQLKIVHHPINQATVQWLTRMLLPLVIGLFMFTTTGCSMVMGIFGPTDTAVVVGENVSNDAAARILMPTPAGADSSTAPSPTATAVNGPTPTPFVMRPVNPTAVPLAANPNVGQVSQVANPPARSVTIVGDAVNVRNAPGLDTQILATVPKNSQFDYVGETNQGEWVQICCIENQVAWVFGTLVQITPNGTTTSQPTVNQAQSTTTAAENIRTAIQSVGGQSTGGQNLAAREISILKNSTANTQFISSEGDFALTLPPAWLALADSGGLVTSNLSLIAEKNPQTATMLEDQLANLNDIPVTLIAFNLSAASLASGFPTNVNVLKQPVPAGFPLEYVVQLNQEQLERVLGLSNATESTAMTLPAGTAIVLDYQLSTQVAARQYYLLHNQSLYIITFSASTTLGVDSLLSFDELMQSFQFLD